MEIVTSWERKGMEIGRMEGRTEGRVEGRSQGRVEGRTEGRSEGRVEGRTEGRTEGALDAWRLALLDVLVSRFGTLEDSVSDRVRSLGSIDDLRALTNRALSANSLRELDL